MKIQVFKPEVQKTIIVNIELTLKRTRTLIECKYYVWSKQLNLRMLENKFLIKDKYERSQYESQYLRYTKKIIRKLSQTSMAKYITANHTSVVWWEMK